MFYLKWTKVRFDIEYIVASNMPKLTKIYPSHTDGHILCICRKVPLLKSYLILKGVSRILFFFNEVSLQLASVRLSVRTA